MVNMKIFVEKSSFSNELKLFQGIFEKKTLMDILQNIKLTAVENGLLELVATDLEIGLSSTIKVDVEEPGSFTVNGKDFYDLISRMPEGIVEISEKNDLQIVISNEKKTSKYKLLGLQASNYPQLPEADFSSSVTLLLKPLATMINRNYYIISPEMKFNLGGALLSIGDGGFEMAATDGHRLSFSKYEKKLSLDSSHEFIISRKTLMELNKIGDEGEVEFTFDKNNLFFKFNNRVLSSRVIDQKFPNYKAVIPESTKYKAIVNTSDLLTTLRRVLVFKTRNNGVYFKFTDGKLILERTTPEKGEAHDEMEIEYVGENFSVAFNGNFIVDFLTHIESEQIEIGMNDNDSSFIFKPIQDEELDYIYVVMPLNI